MLHPFSMGILSRSDSELATSSGLRTQITNKAVIRVWEKLGFLYGKGEHIFRILL